MKFILLLIVLFVPRVVSAQCEEQLDLLIVGDSQSGAAWSRSYMGNFLPSCLQGNFILYGRGGTVPASWLGNGSMDHIETVQRDSQNHHQNLGSGEVVPLCKRRIAPMLASHRPRKVLFQFGGNMIGYSDRVITNQLNALMSLVDAQGISVENCYFLTPTFEMEVTSRRNVPSRNLLAVQQVFNLIQQTVAGRCQLIDGVELMRTSQYFDGNDLLRRVQITGRGGCTGASENDNVHICGAAAQEMAQKVCAILNQN